MSLTPQVRPPKPIITQSEVARLLGISVQKFRSQREELIDARAFPVPLPYGTSPMLWRRDMVESWLSEQGRPRALPPSPRPNGPNVHLIEEARRA